MYAAVIRASAKWRGIKITAFDRQQLEAIRKELDEAFRQRNQPAVEIVTSCPYSIFDRKVVDYI